MRNYCGWINKNIFSGEKYKNSLSNLEDYQFSFVGKNNNYQNGWFYLNGVRTFGSDLISNWSRQYEYPYVLENILGLDKGKKILDVGSGYSFFPFYLADLGFDVSCSDILDLGKFFYGSNVNFFNDDITESSIKESFDLIYSISVFEHIIDKGRAIENIYNHLKVGGKLILTMDCDLNLGVDKSVPNYGELCNIISIIEKKLSKVAPYNLIRDNDLVTTETFFLNNRWRLPWKGYAGSGIKGIIRRIFRSVFGNDLPSVCVFVGVWEKK